MKKRNIPNTNFSVSPICLGTMTFGTPVVERESIELVSWAIDHGINFIDTANMYEGYARTAGSAGGIAEEILGKALASCRNEVVLATKVGMKVGDAPEDDGTSPAAIRKQLNKSLKRLKTDFIDIYYLHRPDLNEELVDTLQALDTEIQSGKIKHYGVSNYSATQLNELLQVADKNNLPRPVIIQPHFSLFSREEELMRLCRQQNIAVTPYRVLEGGLLTGKYSRNEPAAKETRWGEKPEWMPEHNDELFDRLDQIKVEADKAGLTMTEHAIKWTLKQPGVVSLAIGVKRTDQIASAIESASV